MEKSKKATMLDLKLLFLQWDLSTPLRSARDDNSVLKNPSALLRLPYGMQLCWRLCRFH